MEKSYLTKLFYAPSGFLMYSGGIEANVVLKWVTVKCINSFMTEAVIM